MKRVIFLLLFSQASFAFAQTAVLASSQIVHPHCPIQDLVVSLYNMDPNWTVAYYSFYKQEIPSDPNGPVELLQTSASNKYSPTQTQGEYAYYAKVYYTIGSVGQKSQMGTITTNTVTVSFLDEVFWSGEIGYSQQMCPGIPEPLVNVKYPAHMANPPVGATYDYGTIEYKWQVTDRLEGLFTWEDIPGEGEPGLTLGFRYPTLHYRRGARNTCLNQWYFTDPVTIETGQFFEEGTIGTDQFICYNTKPETIQSIVDPECPLPRLIEWEQSHTGTGSWVAIPGENDITLSFSAPLTATRFYRRKTTSNYCGFKYSNIVKVTVHPVQSGGVLGDDAVTCLGKNFDPLRVLVAPEGGDPLSNSYIIESAPKQNSLVWTPMATFSDIGQMDYQPPSNEMGTLFYRLKTVNLCKEIVSNAVRQEVIPELFPNVIGESQAIEYYTIPDAIVTLVPASGGSENFTYQWEQKKSSDSLWTTIQGAISTSYQPVTLVESTSYRLRVKDRSCGFGYSNVVDIRVIPELQPGTIGYDQLICYATQSDTIVNVTSPTGGNETYSFQWEMSINNQYWYAIDGANQEFYRTGILGAKTYYRRKVASGLRTRNSNVVVVDVYDKLVMGTIGYDENVCFNGSISAITVLTPPSGGAPQFSSFFIQRQLDENTWEDVATYPDANAVEYYAPTDSAGTFYYRLKIENYPCGFFYSDPVVKTVASQLQANVIGDNQEIDYGQYPQQLKSIILATGGYGIYTYQWERMVEGHELWEPIDGATFTTYQPGSLYNTTYFRIRVVDELCGEAFSNVVTIQVYPNLNPGEIGIEQTVCYNTRPNTLESITPVSGGNGNYTFQWESSLNGLHWIPVSQGTLETYRPGTLTTQSSYRRKVSSRTQVKYSNVLTIGVYEQQLPATIGQSEATCFNGIFSPITVITPPEGGNPDENSYILQRSLDGEAWDDVMTYATIDAVEYYAPTDSAGAFYYRLKVDNNPCGVSYSNLLEKLVFGELKSCTIGSDQQVDYGNNAQSIIPSSMASGGLGDYTYQWESKVEGQENWEPIDGATSASYNPGMMFLTTRYRLRVTDSWCGDALSNEISIQVFPNLDPGTIGYENPVCYNSRPDTLVSTIPVAGGNGQYAFRWEWSANAQTWYTISSGSAESFRPGVLTEKTYYRRKVTSGSQTKYSNTIAIDVYEPQMSAVIEEGFELACFGGTFSPIVVITPPMGGEPNGNTYIIQRSKNFEIWEDTAAFFNLEELMEYHIPADVGGAFYYRIKVNNLCGITYSNNTFKSVFAELKANVIGNDQVLEYGIQPQPITAIENASGGVGEFTYQWEQREEGQEDWETINGATSISYSPGVLYKTVHYRLRVIDTMCGEALSNVVTVQVYSELYPGIIGGNQFVCYKTTSDTLGSIEPVSGGDGVYSYVWQQSIDGTSWYGIEDSNNASYSPGIVTLSSYYRRKVSAGSQSKISNTVFIEAGLPLSEPVVLGGGTHCKNSDVVLTIDAPGAQYVYTWLADTTYWATSNTAITISNLQAPVNVQVFYTDEHGCVSDTVGLIVAVDPIKADFYFMPTYPQMGERVNFYSTSGNAVEWLWDLGLPENYSLEHPSAYYYVPGAYHILLVATSPGGCLDTKMVYDAFTITYPSQDDIDVINQLSLYPNPSYNGQFNINLSASPAFDQMVVVNSVGQTVLVKSYDELGDGFYIQGKGVYLVRFMREGSMVANSKIVRL